MDVYYFDTHQKLIGVINEEHIIDAHLTKKINQGSTMSVEIVSQMALPEDARYMLIRDPDGDEYLMFTIQNRKYKQETVTYATMEYAWEQLTNRGLVKDYRPSGKSVRSVLQDVLINYSADSDNWEIRKCNIDTSVNTNFYYLTRTECLTKLVEVIGKGELEFHVDFDGNKIVKTYIDFMAEIGSSNVSYWFEWEKNLIEVTNTSDESEIYASIVPRGKGELVSEGQDGSPDGYGRRIGIEDITWSKTNGDPLDKKKGSDTLTDHEVSNKYGRSYRLVIFEDIDDPKQLIRAAYRELKKHNHKQVQYSASVLDGQTVQLGDHVVIRKAVGHEIAYETRVFMIEYDLLRPQNSRISLGDDLTQDSLSKQISNIGKAIDSVANNSNWGLQNSDGSKTFYSDKEPANAKEGDLWFKQLPNGKVEIWRFENGSWQMVLNQNIGDDIQKQVDDALKSAKEYSDQLNQKTNENIGQLEKTVNSGLAEIQPKIDAAKKDAIDTSQQKVDALNQQVNKDLQTVQPRIDKAKQEAMQDASQKISKVEIKTDSITSIVNNPTTGLSATRTQLDSAIQQEIKDRKTGDTNTLTQSKDFTTSQIKSSESGLKSTISQTAEGIYMNVSRQNLLVDPSLIEEDKWWTDGSWSGAKNTSDYHWFYTPSNRSHGVPSLAAVVTDDTTTGYTWKSSQAIDIKYGFENLYINFDAKTGVGERSTDHFIVYAVFIDGTGKLITQTNVIGTITSNNNIEDWQSFSKKVPIPDDARSMKLVYQLRGKGMAMVSRPYVGLGELEKGQYITGPLQTTNTVLGLFKDNFVLGIKDNVGNIINGINGDTSGLAITGKKVVINGDTTVNGDFWTKNVNAVKVNASNITTGTLDAEKVELVNLTANQITTGTLQGININVNKTLEIATDGLIKWNTDAVIRGYSDNPSYWKGVGDGKFSVVNITEKGSVKMDTKSLITLEGQLKAPENTSKRYLGKMWTHSTGPASNSAFGRNRISSTGIELQIYEKKPLDGVDVSYVTSINANGINMGTAYVRPTISLSALSGTISGRRVRLGGDVANPLNFYNQMMLSYFGQDGNTPPRFQIESYDGNTPTVSYSANMYMTRTGAIFKTSSKRAKKTNIRHDFTLEKANALVDLQPATWHDKAELERTDDAPLVPVRHFGMVAEELEQAGLSQLVEYDEDGNVMSISYDRLAIALIPAIRSLRERVGELEYKLNKIKEN